MFHSYFTGNGNEETKTFPVSSPKSPNVSVRIHETLIHGLKCRQSCPNIDACLTLTEKKKRKISSASLNLQSTSTMKQKNESGFGSDTILGVFDIKIIIETSSSKNLNSAESV